MTIPAHHKHLSKEGADLIDSIKKQEARFLTMLDDLAENMADPRALAVARTHVQTATMWTVRAVTQKNEDRKY
jgi:hypothetical protein